MGYAVILMLFFYTGVAVLGWASGLIPDTSSMHVQDIRVLILSGVITAAIAIYGRRELIRSKDKMTDGGPGSLIRGVGALGLVIFSLVAILKVVHWVSKNAPSIPTKVSTATPLNVVKPLIIMPDPKPNFSSVISGKSQRDIDTYYSLRENAFIGDGGAMLKMSDFTRSGKINDPGEPYYGYWLFQALHSTQVSVNSTRMTKTKAQEVCRNEVDRRRSNRLFDTACSSLDGINYSADAAGSSALIEQFQKKQMMQKIENENK